MEILFYFHFLLCLLSFFLSLIWFCSSPDGKLYRNVFSSLVYAYYTYTVPSFVPSFSTWYKAPFTTSKSIFVKTWWGGDVTLANQCTACPCSTILHSGNVAPKKKKPVPVLSDEQPTSWASTLQLMLKLTSPLSFFLFENVSNRQNCYFLFVKNLTSCNLQKQCFFNLKKKFNISSPASTSPALLPICQQCQVLN